MKSPLVLLFGLLLFVPCPPQLNSLRKPQGIPRDRSKSSCRMRPELPWTSSGA